MGTRLIVIGGVVAALLGSFVAPAEAALFVVLDREEGPPGAMVVGRTGGAGAFGKQVQPLPAYLVPSSIVSGLNERVATEQTLVANRQLARVGELIVDARGNGSIAFDVPDVAPGTYQLFLYCETCRSHSAGRTFVPVAELRVTDPLGRYRRRTVPWIAIAAAVLVSLLAIVAASERRTVSRGR